MITIIIAGILIFDEGGEGTHKNRIGGGCMGR